MFYIFSFFFLTSGIKTGFKTDITNDCQFKSKHIKNFSYLVDRGLVFFTSSVTTVT